MKEALKSIVVPAVVAAITGPLFSAMVSDYSDKRMKARAARQEQVLKFLASSDDITVNFTKFINTRATGEDISAVRKEARSALEKQLSEAGRLKVIFADSESKRKIDGFENAIAKYAESTKTWEDPKLLKQWVETFDNLVEARRALGSYLVGSSSLSS